MKGRQAQREKFSEDPGVRALAALLSECLEKLPDVLQGRILATDLIFPHSSIEKVEGIYRNDALYETFNEMVANAVLAYCKQRLHSDSRARLKILEIGAGTGGTSSAVFAKLGPSNSPLRNTVTPIYQRRSSFTRKSITFQNILMCDVSGWTLSERPKIKDLISVGMIW